MVLFQGFSVEIGKVISNSRYIFNLRKGINVKPTKFKQVHCQYLWIIQQLEDGLTQSSLAAFTNPPLSYKLSDTKLTTSEKRKADLSDDTNKNKKRRSYNPNNKLRYLINLGLKDKLPEFARFSWNRRLCKDFALIGYSCLNSPDCPFGYHAPKSELSDSKVKAFTEFMEGSVYQNHLEKPTSSSYSFEHN